MRVPLGLRNRLWMFGLFVGNIVQSVYALFGDCFVALHSVGRLWDLLRGFLVNLAVAIF